MHEQPVVVLINNEPTFRWTVSQLLEANGYGVACQDRSLAAVDSVEEIRPTAVVLEATYGSAVTATAIVERLRAQRATRYLPIVVCSPDGKFLHSYGEYLRGQGCSVVGRPFSSDQFIELIDAVTTRPEMLPFHATTQSFVHQSW